MFNIHVNIIKIEILDVTNEIIRKKNMTLTPFECRL
jgi:hypothetical protein